MTSKPHYINEESYFLYFEQKCNDLEFREKYPLIINRINKICQEIKKCIYSYEGKDFFRLHAKVLGLDAQLQIILFLVETVESEFIKNLTEKDILDCAQQDYLTYMKEQCEYYPSEIMDHSLYFSVL